jgi:hypothetical protein
MRSIGARVALYTTLALVAGSSAGCSVMEASGRWTRESGESMEAYSTGNEGFWASLAGYGGRFNKSVGGSIESMAVGGSAATDDAANSAASPAPAGSAAQGNTVQYVAMAPTATTAAPAAAAAAHDASTISRAQTRLLELGYRIGKADGILGPKTKGALRQYQRANRLSETGALDHATLVALGFG